MNKIIEERDSLLKVLKTLDPYSKEYNDVLQNLRVIQAMIDSAKETDHKIALEDGEYEQKEESLKYEREQKEKQIILKTIEVISGITLGVLNIALVVWKFNKSTENYSKLFYDGLRFEQTGIIGSSTVKNLTNNNKMPKVD